MKKTTKIILLISCILMGAGIILAGIGFAIGGIPGISFTGKGISSASTSENYAFAKTELSDFHNISIDISSMADIRLMPSADEHFYVEYLLDGVYNEPRCEVADDTFYLEQTGASASLISFGTGFYMTDAGKEPYCTLYVPEGTVFHNVTVNNDSGNFRAESIEADNTELHLNFGNLTMEDCSFEKLVIEADSGDITAANVLADTLTVSNNFGDSTFENFTGKKVTADIDSGDFYMEARKLDSFTGENDFGNTTLLLPDTLEEYTFDVSTDFGSITLPKNAPGFYHEDFGEEIYQSDGNSTKTIQITVDSGDIEIGSFTES